MKIAETQLEDFDPRRALQILDLLTPEMHEFINRIEADKKISETGVTQTICIIGKRITRFLGVSLEEQSYIRKHAQNCGVDLPIPIL